MTMRVQGKVVLVAERNDILRTTLQQGMNNDDFHEADEVAHAICTLPLVDVIASALITTPNNDMKNASSLVCTNDNATFKTPSANVSLIANLDSITVKRAIGKTNTLEQPRNRPTSYVKGMIEMERFQERSKTTPIDLTRATPNKFSTKGKVTCKILNTN